MRKEQFDVKKLAPAILPAMQSAGQSIIAGTATADSILAHIQEILGYGYNGEIHTYFDKFVLAGSRLPEIKWLPTKLTDEKPRIRRVGEILVDWAVLEASRRLAMGERLQMDTEQDEFIRALPFIPPVFNLEANPYTPIAFAFRDLCGWNGMRELADSGKYDDIFHNIFLWRVYYKEPFHSSAYGSFRSISGYWQTREEIADRARKEEARKRVPIMNAALQRMLLDAYNQCDDEDGWVQLTAVAAYIDKTDPGFSAKTYGYKQFSMLVKGAGLFNYDDSENSHHKIKIQEQSGDILI